MLYELISLNCLIEVDPCQVFLEMADCSFWSINDLRILKFWYKLIYFPSSLPQNFLLSHQNLSPFLTFVLDFGIHFFRNWLNFLPISYFIFIFVFYFYSFYFPLFSLLLSFPLLPLHWSFPSIYNLLWSPLTLSNLVAPQVLIKSFSFHLTVLLFTSHILYTQCNLFPPQLQSFPPQLSWHCFFKGCCWLSSCQIQLQF